MRALVLIGLLLPLAASAQPRDGIRGGDTPLYRPARTAGVLCTVYPEHIVLESGSFGHLDRLVVRELPEPVRVPVPDSLCTEHEGLRVLYETEPSSGSAFLIGLRYPYLVLDLGVEADYQEVGRRFKAVDLVTGASYSDEYQPAYGFGVWRDHQLSFFAEMSGAAGRGERCVEAERADWLAYWFEERLVLDLETLEVHHTGEVACSYRDPY